MGIVFIHQNLTSRDGTRAERVNQFSINTTNFLVTKNSVFMSVLKTHSPLLLWCRDSSICVTTNAEYWGSCACLASRSIQLKQNKEIECSDIQTRLSLPM